jgi:hypothetical protein
MMDGQWSTQCLQWSSKTFSGPVIFFLLNHISRWLIPVNSEHFICTKCYIIITCLFHWGVLDLCFKWQSLPSFSSLTSWSPHLDMWFNKKNMTGPENVLLDHWRHWVPNIPEFGAHSKKIKIIWIKILHFETYYK